MVATLPLHEEDSVLDDIRHTMRTLKPKASTKLHWYDNVEALRNETIDAIRSMPLQHWAVVVHPTGGERPERTRRACMARILWELEQQATVDRIVFESRGDVADRRDMRMVQGLRSSRTISSRMRVDHVRGADEPLLWLPDAVCGVVNGRILGPDTWSGRLDHQLRIVS